MYVQLAFALDRVKALAPQHPEWKTQQPFASVLEGRSRGALAGRREGHAADRHGHARRHDDRGVRDDRRRTGSPPRAIPDAAGSTPRWSTSRCSSCSTTCAPTASRPSSSPAAASSSCAPWTERVYGIPPEQVVGSSIKTKYEAPRRQAGAGAAAGDRLHRRQGRQARRHQPATSAGARSSPSATPTATSRCSNGPPAATGRGSA